MDTKLATRQIRIQEWAAIIKDRNECGLKIDDYCSQHGISRDAYYYWLRKVKEAALVQNGFVEMPTGGILKDKPESKTKLVANINGIGLEIYEGISPDFLREVIGAIKNA